VGKVTPQNDVTLPHADLKRIGHVAEVVDGPISAPNDAPAVAACLLLMVPVQSRFRHLNDDALNVVVDEIGAQRTADVLEQESVLSLLGWISTTTKSAGATLSSSQLMAQHAVLVDGVGVLQPRSQ
jgi:hypothetical protein